ncbi:MAG: DUF350 domain-containing protein [Pseudomonadota bacterium]
MKLDVIITGLVLIVGFFVIFLIGKVVNDLIHREYDLNEDLVKKDNPALALSVTGYYFGLVLCIGGALAGPSHGVISDLIDLAAYGLLGIILLNISWYICDKVILYKFKLADELMRDRNQGTGAVSAGVSIASGFIIYGSTKGEGGGILTLLVFWALGQILLIIAGRVYTLITPYDVHGEIEKDNVAAGVSFAGALIAMGVVVGLAAEGDFISWEESLPGYLAYALFGLIMLPAVRWLTDRILFPTVKLSDEIVAGTADQDEPNVGAAYIEAFAYIAGAFVIFWCV